MHAKSLWKPNTRIPARKRTQTRRVKPGPQGQGLPRCLSLSPGGPKGGLGSGRSARARPSAPQTSPSRQKPRSAPDMVAEAGSFWATRRSY
jgi:hypothetical protein